MTSIKTLTVAAGLLLGASTMALAQGAATTTSPNVPVPQAQSGHNNGQELGTGPNAQSYPNARQGRGREQPEQKQDMGSESGK